MRIQEQAHVHELIGKQRAVLIVKHGFEGDGAGLGVNLVVCRDQPPRREFFRAAISIQQDDSRVGTSLEACQNLGQIILLDIEEYSDRVELRDDNQVIS